MQTDRILSAEENMRREEGRGLRNYGNIIPDDLLADSDILGQSVTVVLMLSLLSGHPVGKTKPLVLKHYLHVSSLLSPTNTTQP